MSSRGLRVVLVLAALIILAPFVPWLLAVVFESIDDKWLDSLGGLAVSIPVGLGVGAIAFALHGLTMHHDLVDQLEEGLELLAARDPLAQQVGIGAPAAGFQTAASMPVAAAAAGPATAVAEPQEQAAASGEKKTGAPTMGGTVKSKVKSAGKNRAGFLVRSRAQQAVSRWTPRI